MLTENIRNKVIKAVTVVLIAILAITIMYYIFQVKDRDVTMKDKIGGETEHSFSTPTTTVNINNEQMKSIDNAQYNNELNISDLNDTKNNKIDNTIESYVVASDVKDEVKNKHTYKRWDYFPYHSGIQFANEDIFKAIKKAFANIDFYGEFKKGNMDVYDFYKEKYKQFITNEVAFFDKEENKELYLGDLSLIGHSYQNKSLDDCLKEYSYIFFDMDEDGAPELCITDITFCYVFKYIPDKNEFILWLKLESTYYGLIGTKKTYWNRLGDNHAFYKYDESGKDEYTVHFFMYYITNEITEEPEIIHMVALPYYENKEEQVIITEDMRIQGYFDETLQVYYFRVTEEQYEELTKDYMESLTLAQKNIKEVTFTYEELFGE